MSFATFAGRFLMLGLSMSILGACAQDAKTKMKVTQSPQQGAGGTDSKLKPVDLSKKSLSEVFDLKYNQVQLKCSLWSQSGKKLDLKADPNSSSTLDFKKLSKVPQTLKLSFENDSHKLNMTILVNKLAIISKLDIVHTDGKRYVAQYSPTIEYAESHEVTYIGKNGQEIKTQGSSTHKSFERIPEVVYYQQVDTQNFSSEAEILNSNSLFDYVSCVIATDIKSQYKDQFQTKEASSKNTEQLMNEFE